MITTLVRDETLMAEAVFASNLQPSQRPTLRQLRAAIDAALRGCDEGACRACIDCMAQYYGDEPELAAARMHWAIDQVARLLKGKGRRAA